MKSALIGSTLHELAHIIDQRIVAPSTDGGILRRARELREASFHEVRTALNSAAAERVWHGIGFLRTCAHLLLRVHAAGYSSLLPDDIVGRTHMLYCYGLSPFTDYIDALGDEPIRFIGRPFNEIRKAQPPAPFVRLWHSDVSSPAEAGTSERQTPSNRKVQNDDPD